MKRKILIIGIAIIIAAIAGVVAWQRFFGEKPVACTMEAKICPDGSYVGRTGPKCEFALCPGATFQYPEQLQTKYIFTQEWPPKLLIIDGAGFSCKQGGLGINGRPGMTIQKKMNNIVYCIENVSGGAAGTFYTDYTYTFLKDSKLVKLSFTLAYPQCANYDDPQKTECEKERQTFDLDTLINRIAESVQLLK
jgi:hypothetical protein